MTTAASRHVDCLVVGSGPSGVACASALLQRGRRVHMLDAGVQLEPDREAVVQQLSQARPGQWKPEAVQLLKKGEPQPPGLPDKLAHGSRYPYKGAEEHLGQVLDGVGLRGSLALGGLSTVWGAAMLPSLDRDIEDWPVTTARLAEHYASAAALVRPSGGPDNLESLFPLYGAAPGPLNLSRQAQVLWNRLESRQDALRRSGIHFGRARLAIRTPGQGGTSGCVYCAMCMHGCPYGHIYNSASTVAELRKSASFTYQPGIVVRTVNESGDRVAVQGHHFETRAPFEVSASRVYLAAGVIPTTGILLRSLSAYDRPVLMKDSQYFLLPVLLPRAVTSVQTESMQTLSQIFLELIDPSISRHTVHLQVYSYSDPIGKALRSAMGPLAGPLEFVPRALEGRLLLFQGFIHSADSSEIEVRLTRAASGDERLVLKAVRHARARSVVRRVVRRLVSQSWKLNVVPLPMAVQFAEPGRSFHSGGTFPMHQQPTTFETDVWGRPAGWQRVHAVDASVMPSVPATTITFTVMANAHRIGWETAAAAMNNDAVA